ncbi:Apm4p KNAG_0K01150 [Huiozyma naganishii CBS 8797]|uniref:MHD domain-containing protein n=1 Tax=Huiozyma naganishii (strain ATCC MYA-139 / BCRC 22969 / CBS 8797 / KCTC 17520 / NBRC 10181 / NCYC 3082 / Yp74L-3) TaxID=1071383 RepID=J7RC98_HUIN7|nr:hypothetical protein KNAG_0K01150 [Kazachstania naganishii CBS 8797]CCK72480.1 hypothetical protein KNAG_0K01150 [Kazachstania naganishii CBS 8797]
MINAVLVYSARGELIVSKMFKPTLKRSVGDIFRVQVINSLDVRSPILTLGSTTFHYVRTPGEGLWVVSVSRNNENSAATWEFLYKFATMLAAYRLDSEEVLKEEFMLAWELLDTMVEGGGIPSETDPHRIISAMSVKPAMSPVDVRADARQQQTTTSTGAFGHAFPQLLHRASNPGGISILPHATGDGAQLKRNEIVMVVQESISILVSKDGSILKAYVDGGIDLTTKLEGAAVCQFGLNDSLSTDNSSNSKWDPLRSKETQGTNLEMKNAHVGTVLLRDCKFHQCVSLERFDRDRIIRFTPPEGTIELMKYHVRDNLNLPFKVTSMVIPTANNETDYRVTIKSLFPGKLSAKNVTMRIPVPPGTLDCKINVSNGNCKFLPEENAMVWKFHKYNGLTENKLSAITVPTRDTTQLALQQWSRPPISLDFEILMYSNTGLVVRYFTVLDKHNNNTKFKTVKWIKYVSHSGSYEVRY